MYIYFIQRLLLLALRKIFPDSHIDSPLIIKKGKKGHFSRFCAKCSVAQSCCDQSTLAKLT